MFKAKRIKLNSLGPEIKLSIRGKNKKKNSDNPFNQTGLYGSNDFLSENNQKVVFRLDSRKQKDSSSGFSTYFEGLHEFSNGSTFIDVEDDDMKYVISALDVNKNGKISKSERKKFVFTPVTSESLIENHSNDAEVTKYFPSENVLFEYTPKPILFGKPAPGTLEFNTDIVSIGINDNGDVLSFLCPQEIQKINNMFVSGSIKSEVEVGEVSGKIDPLTGEGVIYGDEMAWKFWGDIKVLGKKVSISKEDAAFIPIEDNAGEGGLLALHSIERGAHGKSNIDNVFASYLVKGMQGNPVGIQKGLLQETVIQGLNAYMPGFANGGTALQWNIDLRSPVSVVGNEYLEMAHALEMH
jgi:hypothetical protein